VAQVAPDLCGAPFNPSCSCSPGSYWAIKSCHRLLEILDWGDGLAVRRVEIDCMFSGSPKDGGVGGTSKRTELMCTRFYLNHISAH
jgi:hypothetical protein